MDDSQRMEKLRLLAIFIDPPTDRPSFFLFQNTDQRTTDFKYLTSKDQELSREIEVKIRKIERLQSSLQHWRTKVIADASFHANVDAASRPPFRPTVHIACAFIISYVF